MKNWCFAKDNDNLIKLVLSGKKVATSYLYSKNDIPKVGEKSILHFENEKDACIIKTTDYKILRFCDVTEEMAKLEGEGDLSLKYWQNEHFNFFKSVDRNFNSESLIIFERFEVTCNLINKRLELGIKIATMNLDLFRDIKSIYEINAGYCNTLFSVNDRYVIKVSKSAKNKKLIKKEYDFYKNNTNNPYFAKLYKFDDSHKIVPYSYLIMEKLRGNTLYYYWYKMSEESREKVASQIAMACREFHKPKKHIDNFAYKIKSLIVSSITSCMDLFESDSYKQIIKSFDFYDEILSDNRYATIHNDLHFDNIFYYNGNIKLIDFNDYIIAPIDFEFRQIHRMLDEPWKYANSEMDPYQKPEDYKNLFNYILNYYPELNKIKYLNERMIIFDLYESARHLPRFRTKELVSSIVSYTTKLNKSIQEKINEGIIICNTECKQS